MLRLFPETSQIMGFSDQPFFNGPVDCFLITYPHIHS